MNKPCLNCGEEAHHTLLCIKEKNSTLGAPASAKTPMDPQFSTWPEVSKQAQNREGQFEDKETTESC